MANYARKGTLLGVVGRIQTRNYDNQQGQRVYVTEVICESFQLLEPKSANENRNSIQTSQNDGTSVQNNFESNYATNQNKGLNQQNNSQQMSFGGDVDPFAGAGNSIDISDDDLPF